jgi:hypothetical protein
VRWLTSAAAIGIGTAIGLLLLGFWPVDPWYESAKVCQLTGTEDRQFRNADGTFRGTLARGFGVTGTDLGYPVMYLDRLLFLFGDTRDHHPDEFRRPSQTPGFDSLAVAPAKPSDPDRCVAIEFLTKPDDPQQWEPIRLDQRDGRGAQPLGIFETPVSGFSAGPNLFAFFTIRHGPRRCGVPPIPAAGDTPPGGKSSLALSSRPGTAFEVVADVSTAKFLWPVPNVIPAKSVAGLPKHLSGDVVLIWGTGREAPDRPFRLSYPYLAVAPLSFVGLEGNDGRVSSWLYFSGCDIGLLGGSWRDGV